jgi:hypothetical protein
VLQAHSLNELAGDTFQPADDLRRLLAKEYAGFGRALQNLCVRPQ